MWNEKTKIFSSIRPISFLLVKRDVKLKTKNYHFGQFGLLRFWTKCFLEKENHPKLQSNNRKLYKSYALEKNKSHKVYRDHDPLHQSTKRHWPSNSSSWSSWTKREWWYQGGIHLGFVSYNKTDTLLVVVFDPLDPSFYFCFSSTSVWEDGPDWWLSFGLAGATLAGVERSDWEERIKICIQRVMMPRPSADNAMPFHEEKRFDQCKNFIAPRVSRHAHDRTTWKRTKRFVSCYGWSQGNVLRRLTARDFMGRPMFCSFWPGKVSAAMCLSNSASCITEPRLDCVKMNLFS